MLEHAIVARCMLDPGKRASIARRCLTNEWPRPLLITESLLRTLQSGNSGRMRRIAATQICMDALHRRRGLGNTLREFPLGSGPFSLGGTWHSGLQRPCRLQSYNRRLQCLKQGDCRSARVAYVCFILDTRLCCPWCKSCSMPSKIAATAQEVARRCPATIPELQLL